MVKVTGKDKALRRLRRMGGAGAGGEFGKTVNAALFEAAERFKADAQHSITAGSVSGKSHVASLPGEAPQNDSGHLKDNIEATQPRPFVARVASEARYSAALEFGTSKMAARPFMRPARERERKPALKILRAHLRALERTNR